MPRPARVRRPGVPRHRSAGPLSPRIRDLGKITFYRTGPKADFEARYPHAGALLTRRLNTGLIIGMWDDLLRVAASVKGGHATAALVGWEALLVQAAAARACRGDQVVRDAARGRPARRRRTARAHLAEPPRQRALRRHPTPSTSTANSPSSTTTATGHCGCSVTCRARCDVSSRSGSFTWVSDPAAVTVGKNPRGRGIRAIDG